jgi:Cu(I)/Ag(I) efflux system membrane fusion protein
MRETDMSNALKLVLVALASAALGAGGYAWFAQRPASSPGMPAQPGTMEGAAPQRQERKILYWHDPMVPQQRFDKPGKSPFMDMDLVPVYADEAQGGTVAISPRVTQNLGVRYAAVEKDRFEKRVEAVGTVRVDETSLQTVQARVGGFIERQSVRSLNEPVARGQILAELTSPELVAAQEELLLAAKSNDTPLVTAARERLSLLGLSAGQVRRIEASGKVQRSVALAAPSAGIVTELNARPGMTVMPGAALYTLANLSHVWVIADIPESESAWIVPGREAQVRFAALPGEKYAGKVDYLYPEIVGETRTLRARIKLANPKGSLKPGMLANVSLYAGSRRDLLLVPSEAVIETGKRSVVIAAEAEGSFRAIEVKTGAEREGRTEILSGLSAGQRIVASGQFLIDSEASLKTALTRLEVSPADPAPESSGHQHDAKPGAATQSHRASGRVVSLDPGAGKVKITHGAVPTLKMPGMTMGFPVTTPEMLQGIQAGQEVEFELVDRGNLDLVITRITPRKEKP